VRVAIAELLAPVVVLPVVMIANIQDAVPLARALITGGLAAIEITLRTPVAVEAIRQIRLEIPDAIVGAGTVTTPAQIEAALDAGAQFLVSPGSSPRLIEALHGGGVPFLPGAATASEVIALLECGVTEAKLFPASALDGLATLRGFGDVFPQMRFCATGGITEDTACEYLALPNVVCVGGSWMVPTAAARTQDWGTVARLARHAAKLKRTEVHTPSTV
jgi:2-dehydro-3-deoxyphosphogluconate aldolase / (4S)-4-hydroxy-2-oxoglutarate aldolase